MKFAAITLLIIVSCSHALKEEDVVQKFKSFQAKFQKTYNTPREAGKRLMIFEKNLKEIEEHNALYETGKTSYKKGVNQFTDWTHDEFKKFVNSGTKNRPQMTGELFEKSNNFEAPKRYDWREKGAVTGVKDQGNCGSCWSFSVTGTVEGQLKIVRGNLTSLSEQNLMDCSWYLLNFACGGGEMYLGLDYVQQHGLESEADYPYTVKSSLTCKADESKIVTRISSYVTVGDNDEEGVVEALVTKGPLSVAIYASDNLSYYESGIYRDETCIKGETNHGVLMVGYGTENGQDYYLVKNSWGTSWGENGYVKFSRNPRNMCEILSQARYPRL